jgi:heme exporter protein CcmD
MLRDFISMGGYGPFVWSCYALTLAVLVWIGLSSRRQLAAELVRARRRAQVSLDRAAAGPDITEK